MLDVWRSSCAKVIGTLGKVRVADLEREVRPDRRVEWDVPRHQKLHERQPGHWLGGRRDMEERLPRNGPCPLDVREPEPGAPEHLARAKAATASPAAFISCIACAMTESSSAPRASSRPAQTNVATSATRRSESAADQRIEMRRRGLREAVNVLSAFSGWHSETVRKAVVVRDKELRLTIVAVRDFRHGVA
jgi:hypothetical protein